MNWTPKRESEIAERCEKATPGPWCYGGDDRIYDDPEEYGAERCLLQQYELGHEQQNWDNDAEFIAHARTDLPDALSEIKRLRERELSQ